MRLILGCLFLLVLGSLGHAAAPASADRAGLVVRQVERADASVAAVSARLRELLAANPKISVVRVFDHAANARRVGLDLAPTRLIVFGNPALGTPLMQAAGSTGIDLPQKFLVYRDGSAVFVAYNAPAYLQARHGIDDHARQLDAIGHALRDLVAKAIGTTPGNGGPETLPVDVGFHQGLVVKTSNADVATTSARLARAVRANPNIALIDRLDPFDHAENAQSVGLALAPTRLFVFGNPRLGTPLMRQARTLAIDLPQKMLVYRRDGEVFLAYNAPDDLGARHGLQNQAARLDKIAQALASLANQATGSE